MEYAMTQNRAQLMDIGTALPALVRLACRECTTLDLLHLLR
jgi:hypothetical protein